MSFATNSLAMKEHDAAIENIKSAQKAKEKLALICEAFPFLATVTKDYLTDFRNKLEGISEKNGIPIDNIPITFANEGFPVQFNNNNNLKVIVITPRNYYRPNATQPRKVPRRRIIPPKMSFCTQLGTNVNSLLRTHPYRTVYVKLNMDGRIEISLTHKQNFFNGNPPYLQH